MNNSSVNCIVESGFKCIWKIENIDQIKNCTQHIRSPYFKVGILLNSEWFLEIRQENVISMGVFLFKTRGDTRYNNVDFSISIFTRCGWITLSSWNSFKFKSGGDGFGNGDLIKWRHLENERNGYLLNKSLILGFRMFNGSTDNVAAQCLMTSRFEQGNLSHRPLMTWHDLAPGEVIELPFSILNLSEASKELEKKQTASTSTQTESSSDDIFHNLVNTFTKPSDSSASGNQLASSTFPKINNNLSQEMKTLNIDTKFDDEDENFMSFLLHSVQPELLSGMTWDATKRLYYASKKYNVTSLKKSSVLLLAKKLSTENICEAFLIAEDHRDEDLKQRSLEYFVSNSKTILKSLEWKDLKIKRPELTLEVLSEFAEKLQN